MAKTEKAQTINSVKLLVKEGKKDLFKTIVLLLTVTFCIVVVIFAFSFANKKEKGDEQQPIVYNVVNNVTNNNTLNVYTDTNFQTLQCK